MSKQQVYGPGECSTRECVQPRQQFPSGLFSSRCLEHDREKARRTMKMIRTEDREEFLRQYGRTCACCAEANPLFLTVSHTFGDGAAHRLSLGNAKASATKVMRDLRRRGWPKDLGIEVECFNCNMGAYRNGGICPHRAS